MRSDAQRRADAAYRQTHTDDRTTLTVRLPTDQAKMFKDACAERDTTVNAVLRFAIEKYIAEKK